MEKVSIIIPVYNVVSYLEATIRSALNQTFSNIEIILIDDGSTDGSELICDKYAKQDKRIVVVHQENGGVAVARNIGLEKSSGDYIFFLDSDDLIVHTAIEVLLSGCKEKSAPIAVASNIRFKGTPPKLTVKKTAAESLDTKEAIRRMIGNMGYSHDLWNKLFRRELWNGIRFQPGKIYEDLDTTYKVISKADKIAYINENLYLYRVHPGSIMRSPITGKNIELLDISDRTTNALIQIYPDLSEYALSLKAKTYLKLMKNILDTGLDEYLSAQLRIISYIKKERHNLLNSSAVSSKDKIKVRALCMNKLVFYCVYRFGDLLNHKID